MKDLRKCNKIIETDISYLNELRFYRDYEIESHWKGRECKVDGRSKAEGGKTEFQLWMLDWLTGSIIGYRRVWGNSWRASCFQQVRSQESLMEWSMAWIRYWGGGGIERYSYLSIYSFTSQRFTKSAGLGRKKGRRGKHKATLGFPVPPSITMSISSNLCVDLSLQIWLLIVT